MNENNTLISIKNIEIGYERALMRPISLSIKKGDFWGIVGPNGAGKSTLVKTIIGLLPPLSGNVLFPQGKPEFGYVPQAGETANDFPISAFDAVAMGRFRFAPFWPFLSAADKRAARDELNRLGLSERASELFSSLSGGQKQRVLVARALVSEPDVLVLDEPTSGMDVAGEYDMLEFVKSLLIEKPDLSVIMVSHHIAKVLSYASDVCVINREQNVFEAGKVEDFISGDKLSEAYRRNITASRIDGGYYVAVKEQK